MYEPEVLPVEVAAGALDQESGAENMSLVAHLPDERDIATTHDLVYRDSLDELVTVIDRRISEPVHAYREPPAASEGAGMRVHTGEDHR